MSNEIYPLDREWMDEAQDIHTRSVSQRLAPIFAALAYDPDGWVIEWFNEGAGWEEYDSLALFPREHGGCDGFRLAPKRKTVTVENLPTPTEVAVFGTHSLVASFPTQTSADQGIQAIRSAMEGK